MEAALNDAGAARWHAIRVTPGREQRVARDLAREGIAIYLPLVDRLVIVKSARRGAFARPLQFPLLPGYVFVYTLGLTSWAPVKAVAGVEDVLLLADRWHGEIDFFIRHVLMTELDDAATQKIMADQRIASLMRPPKELPKKKAGRRGHRGRKIRRRAALTDGSP